ncbi:MAG: hypothetical protein JHC95_11680 [Solirubrobacteraceae bacterium]|nr:hypothetical protein [Solirubrobacteraceae bacterium]
MTRVLVLVLVLALAAVAGAAPAAIAAPAWTQEQPSPPPGGAFPGPVGEPGDMQFLTPNFGLMIVKNAPGRTYSSGLMVYDGVSWRQLSTVCGGAARGARIALVSEREWWTISDPAPGLSGTVSDEDQSKTLCHFKDGQVVASYAKAVSDVDAPYPSMNAAACAGPSDCWFSGPVVDVPRFGTHLLHWDGASLTQAQHPSARGMADLEPHGGQVLGGTAVGTSFGDQNAFSLLGDAYLDPVDVVGEARAPRLLRTFGAGGVGVPSWPGLEGADRVDVTALDSDGQQLWVAGQKSITAIPSDAEELPPDAPTLQPEPPFLARMGPGDTTPHRVTITAPGSGTLDVGDYIGDVAANPGTDRVWATVTPRPAPGATTSSRIAVVAEIDAAGTVLQRVALGRDDVLVGDAAHIACPATNQCWMVTAGGFLYRLAEPGTTVAENPDPLLKRMITIRPPDPRTPRTPPDVVPQDESAQFVAPPIEAPAKEQVAKAPKKIPALLRVLGGVRVEKKRYIVMRIQVRRRARVQLVGLRRGRTVAKTKNRTLKPGRHTLRMRADRKRWPTALRFKTKDLELPDSAPPAEDDTGAGAGDTVTT